MTHTRLTVCEEERANMVQVIDPLGYKKDLEVYSNCIEKLSERFKHENYTLAYSIRRLLWPLYKENVLGRYD